MTNGHSAVLLAFVLLGLAAATLPAQTSGSIEGTVRDPSQAVIPNVTIELTNEATGVVTTTACNDVGYFLFSNLQVGTYSINVNQQGFRKASITGIKLDIAARVRQDIVLEVGAVADAVTVKANPVQVDTANGSVGTVITTEQIATAVLNGRNYARLAMLVPGAVYQSSGDELSGAGLNSPGAPVSINGLNNKSSGWFVDGAYNTNIGNGEANPHVPVLDTLDEVQVQTSNYSARYGGASAGAIINAVTKSGTSKFHGSAYDYLRNDKMDARNFFSPLPQPLKQNQFGFTIGGPVPVPKLRNKTFFFWSEDWRKRRSAQTILTASPTEDMRNGNFQPEADRTKKPLLDPANKQPFPNNAIPGSRMNANATLLLKTYIPQPNNLGGGFNNYINMASGKLDPRTDTVKIDHNLTNNIHVSFSVAKDNIQNISPNMSLFGSSPYPTLRQHEITVGKNGQARANFIISPRTTNEASFAFHFIDINLLIDDTPGATKTRPAGLKIRDFYPDANVYNLIPTIGFSQGWGGTGAAALPLKPATDDNTIWSDNFTHVAGRHTFQAGGLLFHYNKTQATFNYTQGQYGFDGRFSNYPVADFLLGTAASYSQQKKLFVPSATMNQPEFYGQDDWRVTPKFTLNLGLRFYVIPMGYVEGDRVTSFLPSRYDPAKAPQLGPGGTLITGPAYDPLNGLVAAGSAGVPRGFAPTFYGWAPRFGFAYDPSGKGKLAIRGGYGVSYLNTGIDILGMSQNNPPYNETVSLSNVALDDPSNGVPKAPGPVSVTAYDPGFKRPMVQSWSVTVQKEFPGQFLGSLGYVGTHGTNWSIWYDRNSPVFGTPVAGLDFDPRLNSNTVTVNQLRPFQGYAGMTWMSNGLSSIYHSLQTTFQRRFSNGLALQGAYTFSRNLGESQTRRDMAAQNPKNWRSERGPTDFDRAHVLTMNYVYTLPVFGGRKDVLGLALGNWDVSGFVAAESGLATTPGLSVSNAGLASRADAVGTSPDGPKTMDTWFNRAAFRQPAPGMFGNSGRGVLRGPGFVIWDFSAAKQFPVTEKAKVSFRGELYNFLNHTNWSGVNTSVGSGNYGRITSAREPRKVQLSLRLEF